VREREESRGEQHTGGANSSRMAEGRVDVRAALRRATSDDPIPVRHSPAEPPTPATFNNSDTQREHIHVVFSSLHSASARHYPDLTAWNQGSKQPVFVDFLCPARTPC
jgi:hypothetical protein